MHSRKSERGSNPSVAEVSWSNRASTSAQAAPPSVLLINLSPLNARAAEADFVGRWRVREARSVAFWETFFILKEAFLARDDPNEAFFWRSTSSLVVGSSILTLWAAAAVFSGTVWSSAVVVPLLLPSWPELWWWWWLSSGLCIGNNPEI